MIPSKTSRRIFLKQIAATGLAGPAILTQLRGAASSKGKLRHACIGAGGMGWSDLNSLITHPRIEIVAVCDVDARHLDRASKKIQGVRVYRDWRQLLSKETGRIDSVNVAVPDHMHAAIAMSALRLGKHVYCQKPLAHDLYEVRRLTQEAARRREQVTQMGIQIHSHTAYRTAVGMIQAGIIGKVKEVHSWCGKGWVGQKGKTETRPDRRDPVPDYLDWNLWLGTAPERPFVSGIYHPANWRRWIDFGTGTQGDMACHIMDPVFTALELSAPISITSDGSVPFKETYSPNNRMVHVFPGTKYTAGDRLNYHWYDSGLTPDPALFALGKGDHLPMQGSVFIGEKGDLLLPHIGNPQPLPRERFVEALRAFKAGRKFPSLNHYHQFVDACLGIGATQAAWSYSGPLTETVLMGAIANRFPHQKLLWDARRLRFDYPAANRHLQRTYRTGWQVAGLSSA